MKGKTSRETWGGAKAITHCFLPGIWCPVSLSAMPALEELSPTVLLLNKTLYSLWYVLSPFGSVLCPSSFLPTPRFTGCVGQSEKQWRSWHCASTFEQQVKHCCSINTVFVTNQKHRTVWVAVKKMNCIPTRPKISELHTSHSVKFNDIFFILLVLILNYWENSCSIFLYI